MNPAVLDGFYEEGYHYYMEIREGVLTVRDYGRRLMLTTDISWDEDALEREEKSVLQLKDNVLSRSADGEPFTMIKQLAYDHGSLEMDYFYTIMGDSHYTLKKVDHGPFDHILILDDEWLPKLQGTWVNGVNPSETIEFKDDHMELFWDKTSRLSTKVHVTAPKSYPDQIQIQDEDFTKWDFGFYTFFDVEPEMLTTRMIISDADVPLTAFIRAENLGKIKLPESVNRPIRNTMTNPGYRPAFNFSLNPAPVLQEENEDGETWTCPLCGNNGNTGKFCPICGARRP